MRRQIDQVIVPRHRFVDEHIRIRSSQPRRPGGDVQDFGLAEIPGGNCQRQEFFHPVALRSTRE